ncbi:MAG: PIN domain-containing protein [Acidobacteria bacterium]|nr:PIN domain-containing protein [Acidobacteriota bacterium]
MSKYVLDASAVLTILNQEPGKERVEAVLGQAAVSTVNVAETLGKLMDAGMSEANARASLELLHLEVIDLDIEMARLAGSLKLSTRKLGLSLGDRCCLALGLIRGNTVVTADRLWAKLKLGIQVEVLR